VKTATVQMKQGEEKGIIDTINDAFFSSFFHLD
jgi:hypothetical protein